MINNFSYQISKFLSIQSRLEASQDDKNEGKNNY